MTPYSDQVTAKGAQPAVNFDLTKIDSDLMMTKPIMIPLFGCRGVKGITIITCHSQCVHVVAELMDQPVAKGVVSTCTYGKLQPGLQWVGMIIWNMCSKEVKLPAKLVIGHIQAANIVPESLTLKSIEEAKPEAGVMFSQDGHSSEHMEAQKPTI